MARKGKSTEEIIGFLREAEVRLAQGETAGKICRGAGISEQTYYKWRREYGGLKIDQARLKELERDEGPKKAVSERAGQADPEGSSVAENTKPFPQTGVRGSRCRSGGLPRYRFVGRVRGWPRWNRNADSRKFGSRAALTEAMAARDTVWPLRLPAHPPLAPRRGLAREREAGLPHLAAGRAESAERNNPSAGASGSMTAPASACDRSGPITSGRTTSCKTAPRTGGAFACSL